MNFFKVLLLKIWNLYKLHIADSSAHHVKYTDAEVDAIVATHTAIAGAHHVKYTDANAIAAILADDKYVKNTGDTITDHFIISGNDKYLKLSGNGKILGIKVRTTYNNYIDFYNFTDSIRANILCNAFEADSGKFNKSLRIHKNGVGAPWWFEFITGLNGDVRLQHINRMEMSDGIIKDQKNYIHSALSGTKKLIEIDIGGVPYYFEVYPTKA